MIFQSFNSMLIVLHLIVIYGKNVMAGNPNPNNVNDTIMIKPNDGFEPYITCEYQTPKMVMIKSTTNINDLLISSTKFHFWINIFPIIMAIIGVIIAFIILAHFMINSSLPNQEHQLENSGIINLDNSTSSMKTSTTTTNNDQTSSSQSPGSSSSQTQSSIPSSVIIIK